ncbi:hypothetical protein MRX96_052467 [Rhipicephalus microplus]
MVVLRHHPRNVTSTLQTSFSLRHPPRMFSAEDAATPGGRSGGRSETRCRGASRGCSSSRSRSTELARASFNSQPRSTSRPGHVSLGPTRSRFHTPTTSNSKKPMLSWADKTRKKT